MVIFICEECDEEVDEWGWCQNVGCWIFRMHFMTEQIEELKQEALKNGH